MLNLIAGCQYQRCSIKCAVFALLCEMGQTRLKWRVGVEKLNGTPWLTIVRCGREPPKFICIRLCNYNARLVVQRNKIAFYLFVLLIWPTKRTKLKWFIFFYLRRFFSFFSPRLFSNNTVFISYTHGIASLCSHVKARGCIHKHWNRKWIADIFGFSPRLFARQKLVAHFLKIFKD